MTYPTPPLSHPDSPPLEVTAMDAATTPAPADDAAPVMRGRRRRVETTAHCPSEDTAHHPSEDR